MNTVGRMPRPVGEACCTRRYNPRCLRSTSPFVASGLSFPCALPSSRKADRLLSSAWQSLTVVDGTTPMPHLAPDIPHTLCKSSIPTQHAAIPTHQPATFPALPESSLLPACTRREVDHTTKLPRLGTAINYPRMHTN